MNADVPILTENVIATDFEDGNLNGNILINGSVSPTKRVIYAVNSIVTDSGVNQVQSNRIYLLAPSILTNNYGLCAEGFTIKENDVHLNNIEGQIVS